MSSPNDSKISIENCDSINRKLLEDILLHIDRNNPKRELNYCYVDGVNIVSTDTRALCVVKHGLAIEKPFFIHRIIVEKAVKERRADSFILNPNKITALKQSQEIMTYSMSVPEDIENYRFPDYLRIIPENIETQISFVDNSQLNGLIATQKVVINPRYLPNARCGYIGINAKDLPILIQDGEYEIKTVIMPIIDKFKEFDENGFI